MPFYDYCCGSCEAIATVNKSVEDRNEPVDCPNYGRCMGVMTRMYLPPGITFKGAGFYVNDRTNKS